MPDILKSIFFITPYPPNIVKNDRHAAPPSERSDSPECPPSILFLFACRLAPGLPMAISNETLVG